MCSTMKEFFNTVNEINKLKEKEAMIQDKFCKSNGELSHCFHWILKCALEGSNHCALTVHTCPELYANELKNMGFEVIENRNVFNTLCGYDIKWNNLK